MLLGIICIAFALLTCFVLTPLFNASVAKKVEIVRVSKDIPKDTLITSGMLIKVEVGGYNLPPNILKNKDSIVGKYSVYDMVAGDYVLASKITETPYKENNYLYGLDGKKQLISITIKSLSLGLSGKLQSGDIISVASVNDSGATIPAELTYLEIAGVSYSDGKDVGEKTETESTSSGTLSKTLPSTITLFVNDTQAKMLAFIEAKGAWQAVLVYRGDKANAQKFLDRQNGVFLNGQ